MQCLCQNLKFDVIKKLTNLAENQNVNELAEQYLSKNTKKVGLFVNANIELIEYITEYVNLDFIIINLVFL